VLERLVTAKWLHSGDGSAHKEVMGAGRVRLQQQSKYLEVRVGREEEGVNSLRPELAAMARTLQATPSGVDLLYLCDSETALQKVSWWIGSGPRTTLAGDKVKAHDDGSRQCTDRSRTPPSPSFAL
jgi:hypothetical protein